jgi:hypothetical protein
VLTRGFATRFQTNRTLAHQSAPPELD